MIDPDVMNILICPACKGKVVEKDKMIECQQCGLKYPIRNDIPVMLIEEASK